MTGVIAAMAQGPLKESRRLTTRRDPLARVAVAKPIKYPFEFVHLLVS